MGAPDSSTGFWNDAAKTRQFTHPLDAARLSRELRAEARILDFGCGQGRLCAELESLGFGDVLGLDSSPRMIEAARAANPRLRFEASDGSRLPCADASMDAVLCFAVLTCVPDDQMQRNIVAEFKRVLRPGGLLLISDYPLQSDARNLDRYARFAAEPGGYGTFRLPDGVLLRHHRREWFGELLRDFDVRDRVELDVLTMNGNPARILQLWSHRR
jgi:SAM-dependent methyltransferase